MNIRQFKKKYFICKDSFGKNLYSGNKVEIFDPRDYWFSFKDLPKIGYIYNNVIDGSWIEVNSKHYKLRPFLNREEVNYLLDVGIDPIEGHIISETVKRTAYIKKLK